MATHTTIEIPAGTWTLLNTGGAATGMCSFYPIDLAILIKGTASAVAPSDFVGAHPLPPAPGAIVNQTLAQLWPGMAAQHVYAYAATGGKVVVSCA